ncbi:hypothetical protein ACF0H5_003109 [Mactra antiquata]
MKNSVLCRTMLVLMLLSVLVSETEACWWIGHGCHDNVAKRSTDVDKNNAAAVERFQELADKLERRKREIEK